MNEELPEGWEWTTIGEVADEVRSGYASGKHNAVGAGIPHIRPMNVSRNGDIDLTDVKSVAPDVDERRLQPGDVVFNNTNSPALVGKTALFHLDGEYGFSNHMTRVRVADGVDPGFVSRQLLHLWLSGQLAPFINNHVNQASISSRVLASQVSLAMPSLEVQRQVVAAIEEHLSRLDAAESMLAGTEARRSQLEQALINDRMAGSELRLGDHLAEPLRNGYSARRSDDGDTRILTLTAVTRRSFIDDFTKLALVPDAKRAELMLQPGDVLVQRSNTPELVGTTALYEGSPDWAVFPDLLIRVRPDRERLSPAYLALALRSSPVRRYFRLSAQGLAGSMPKISQATIEDVTFPAPSCIRAQEAIAAEIRRELDVLNDVTREIALARKRTAALRRSMLTAAFSGRLTWMETAA